jgi:hypothetical protein
MGWCWSKLTYYIADSTEELAIEHDYSDEEEEVKEETKTVAVETNAVAVETKAVAVESKAVAVESKPAESKRIADNPVAVDPQKSATGLEVLLAALSMDKTMATTPPRSSAPASSVTFMSPSVTATTNTKILIGGNASEFSDGTKVSQCAVYFIH